VSNWLRYASLSVRRTLRWQLLDRGDDVRIGGAPRQMLWLMYSRLSSSLQFALLYAGDAGHDL